MEPYIWSLRLPQRTIIELKYVKRPTVFAFGSHDITRNGRTETLMSTTTWHSPVMSSDYCSMDADGNIDLASCIICPQKEIKNELHQDFDTGTVGRIIDVVAWPLDGC